MQKNLKLKSITIINDKTQGYSKGEIIMCEICENGINSCEVRMPKTSRYVMKSYPDSPPFCPECGKKLRQDCQRKAKNDKTSEQLFRLSNDRTLVVGMESTPPSVGISLRGPAMIDELVASMEYDPVGDVLKTEIFDSSSCDPRYIAYLKYRYK